MAKNLACDDEKKKLTRTFKQLDTNGDGVLTKEEIRVGYSNTSGITNAELNELFK
jgi:Ca2+-binding EF-hand superfamily protein